MSQMIAGNSQSDIGILINCWRLYSEPDSLVFLVVKVVSIAATLLALVIMVPLFDVPKNP